VLILRFLSRSLAISKLLIKYATNEPEGVQLKSILTKSDFLLCVHVVVETLNLETEFHVFVWQTIRKRNVLKCVPQVQHDYFSPFNQSDHCFLTLSLPLKSLLKLLIQVIVIAISFDFTLSQHHWFGIFSWSKFRTFSMNLTLVNFALLALSSTPKEFLCFLFLLVT